MFIAPGFSPTILNNGIDVSSSVSQVFNTITSGMVTLSAAKTGVFSTLAFNLQMSDGRSWVTFATWDAKTNTTQTFYLNSGAIYQLFCTGFVGGTNVSVTATIPTTSTGGATASSNLSLTNSVALATALVDSSGNQITTLPVSLASLPAVTQQTLTKGTQGATGVTTQDLKDSGRVIKVFSASFSAATTEALVTLTPITDGTAGSTGTSFTITAGKRFRIQALSVTTRNAGAVVQGVVCNLRMSASGAVTASSPLIGTAGAGTLSATANIPAEGFIDFPDGLELSGTMQFGISQVGTATAGNIVTLVGYEY